MNTYFQPIWSIPVESKIFEGMSPQQAETIHFSALDGTSPSMHNFGCSASRNPPPRLDHRNHLLGSDFGESCQWCPGRDAPGSQGGCLSASLAGSQAEQAGLGIILSTIKTHLSKRDICMENCKGKIFLWSPVWRRGPWESGMTRLG